MSNFIDLTGKRFGRLVVLNRATEVGINPIKWHCQCDCGNTCDVVGSRLKNGNTKSCGCLHKEQLAERNASNSSVKVGNRYGKLVIIKDLGFRQQKSRNKRERWSLCQCDCGNTCEASNNSLQTGIKKSCGCLVSQGEAEIEKILNDNNVQFIKQYSFKDFKTNKGGTPKFDFAIFENEQLLYLIEFDGRQHYMGMDPGLWSQSEPLEVIQERDQQKNDYCKSRNIILKRIPYTYLNKIKYEDIISDKFNIK